MKDPLAESDDMSTASPTPRSVDELTARNVRTIVALDDAELAKRTTSDRIADVITQFCGTIAFVWVHVLWFGGWILLNVFAGSRHFDEFPFSFLTLVVSLEAIFLSTFILISENRQSRLSERRGHLDLQINLLAEQENTRMLQLLERIAEKVGAKVAGDPEIRVLREATQPEQLAEQIERAMEHSEQAAGPDKVIPPVRHTVSESLKRFSAFAHLGRTKALNRRRRERHRPGAEDCAADE